MKLNSYDLSREWFNFCFDNPEKIRPLHTAILFFAIEHCNRLGWKEKFGFPTSMAMEAIGVKKWHTYAKALNELVDFGFIKMIEKSKNQYSANIISLKIGTPKKGEALDKALAKHGAKHSTKQLKSKDDIIKQVNKEQGTSKQYKGIDSLFFLELCPYFFDKDFQEAWKDWETVRTKKRCANSERAYKAHLNKLNTISDSKEKSILIVGKSADKGYTELYALKNNEKQNNANEQFNQNTIELTNW